LRIACRRASSTPAHRRAARPSRSDRSDAGSEAASEDLR
jgi:hypothetical protein